MKNTLLLFSLGLFLIFSCDALESVDCDVLNADGGTRTASISGAYIATYLALRNHFGTNPNRYFKNQVAAVSAGLVDGNPLLDDKGKHILKESERKNRVKVDSIFAREKDLSLALKTPSIRIETPVLGESLVGIEVPNPNPGVIGIKSLSSNS